MNIFIYYLSDSRGNIRYVGKTKNELRKRLYKHIQESIESKRPTHKINWIKSLLDKGERPIINIIDEVPENEWTFWEEYWISQFKSWGFNLTNLTIGGEGGNGYKHTSHSKKKMSESKLGNKLSENQKKKISESIKKKSSENPNYNHCHDKTHIIDKNLLYQKYINENLSLNKCAKFFETSKHTIFRNITEYGFKKSKEKWISQVASHPKKAVLQYSLSGDFIKEWDSVISIEIELGFNKSNISNCCRGIIGTSRGYIWKYKNNI